MNLKKKITVYFLTALMILGLSPQIVKAEDDAVTPLQYEVTKIINEDKTEATISIDFMLNETVVLEKVLLPDGVELTDNLTNITYTVTENGVYDFAVNFLDGNNNKNELISVEVNLFSNIVPNEKTNPTPSIEPGINVTVPEENILTTVEPIEDGIIDSSRDTNQKIDEVTSDVVLNDPIIISAENNIYTVKSSEQLDSVLEQIKESTEPDAVILIEGNIDNYNFVGVKDKTVTVKSSGNNKYKLTLGSELIGDIILDNVNITGGTLYCNDHKTIFTENCEFVLGSIFGGAYEKDVDNVYVKINGKGTLNTGDSELVIVGGSYKGSVNGDVYMEIVGDITINSTSGGHFITGGCKETRYGGDIYNGEPLYVKGNINLILGLNNDGSGHNVSGTHNTHVYGDINLNIKSGKYIGIDGQREDPKKSIVDGNINMIIGEANGVKPVYVTYNWGIVGAGEKIANSTDLYYVQKNVNITTYDNVWCWEPGEKPSNDIGGLTGAESAIVGGNVNIEVNGSHLKHIIGVDTGINDNSPTIKGNLNIVANDAHLESKYTECFIYTTTDNTFINGNALITMNGGRLNQISAYNGVVKGKVEINLTGNPIITHDVIGKEIDSSSSEDISVLNINNASVKIPNGIWFFKTVNINKQSSVILGDGDVNALRSHIYDININDSNLTTNNQAYSKGSLKMNNSSLTTNGNTYISGSTISKNSVVNFKEYVGLGYGYKDSNHDSDVLISENDTYVFGPNTFRNSIYGNSYFTNGATKLYGNLKIYGNYNAFGTNILDLYAYSNGDNYPKTTIPLEILGVASGNVDVTLVNRLNTSEEGEPIVGQNYISALKASEDVFELANNNAKLNGYYFNKIEDIHKKGNYDMWQVAKKDSFNVIYSFVSGTRGKSLPQEVTELLPIDSNSYFEGDTITAIKPIKTVIEVNDGLWKFEGYDADTKIANKDNADNEKNINFEGKWIFETKKYTVSYQFESKDKNIALPNELKDLLPSNGSVNHGKTVKAPKTSFDDKQVLDGVWTFDGWSPIEFKNVTDNVEFIGIWSFHKSIADLNFAPVINASNKTLVVGDTYDPLVGVTAADKEDGDITNLIEVISNNVDTTVHGTYEVTYKVTDSKDASTLKTIFVTVNPKLEILNQVPTINANNKTLVVGDTYEPLVGVTATDKEDGDITNLIEVISNNVDTTTTGTYEVTFKVTDSRGASTLKTICVTIKSKAVNEKQPNNNWDDGGPFSTDECGKVFDRWGNLMWAPDKCIYNVDQSYNFVNTSDR